MRNLGELDQSVTPEEAERVASLTTERELLEGQTADQLVDLVLSHGQKVSEYERIMNLASEVLEGAYGTSVEAELEKRETKNGHKQT